MYRSPNIPVLFCDGGCKTHIVAEENIWIAIYLLPSSASKVIERRARDHGWYLDNGLKGKVLCPECKQRYEEVFSDGRHPDFKLPETGNFFNGKGPEVKEYNRSYKDGVA